MLRMPEFAILILGQMSGFVVRSLIAVLAGGVVAAVLFQVGAVSAFVGLYGIPLGASAGPPTVGYFVLNLGFAGIAALAGGWLTARLARQWPLAHVGVLALVLAAVALWGFTGPASQWPPWYPPALALVALAGTLAGALLRSGRVPE
jgi:hypothetical protein